MRLPLITRRLAAASLASLLLVGCQTLGADGLVASSAPPELSAAAASAIAGDMVSRLAEQAGPGTGTIVLKADSSPFGQALQAALKGWGYAVATDQNPDGRTILLAYVIDNFDGQYLARLSTGSIEIGRVYTVTASGAMPASPLSIMQRG